MLFKLENLLSQLCTSVIVYLCSVDGLDAIDVQQLICPQFVQFWCKCRMFQRGHIISLQSSSVYK